MSALLGQNPIPYLPWKGRVGLQISSSIQKNRNTQGETEFETYRRAMPLKIYRREIAANIDSSQRVCTHSRISASIDELARPNGASTTQTTGAGVEHTYELPAENSRNNTEGCGAAAISSYNCVADNARRRVRSSGMVKRKFDPAGGDSAYFTDSKQYLVSRSRTYAQNSYHHVRATDVSLLSFPDQSKSNIYVPNGISHCPKTQITAENNTFSYFWIDASNTSSTQYSVDIPAGAYDVHMMNSILVNAMETNKHYLYNQITHSKEYLAQFIFNSTESKIELQLFSTSNYMNPINYAAPIGVAWTLVAAKTMVVLVPATGFRDVVGFSAGYYPPIVDTVNTPRLLNNGRTVNYAVVSNIAHTLTTSYLPVQYKPSNSRFAQQGGVSSSSMTVRRKYETITNAANSYASPFGRQVSNALAYGVNDVVYTGKQKMGFPINRTPVVCKNTGEIQCNRRGGKMFNG